MSAFTTLSTPQIRIVREHAELSGMRSIGLLPENLATYDASLICTDHNGADYEALVQRCPLVVYTRNAIRDVENARAARRSDHRDSRS